MTSPKDNLKYGVLIVNKHANETTLAITKFTTYIQEQEDKKVYTLNDI